jgi:CRP-like cAMP-binding protein
MKSYYLTLDEGSGPNTVFPLLETTTIGRGSDNTITLTDPAVSRNHAKVDLHEGAWIVEDLGSVNGILKDGERVERVVLRPGDTFHIGGTAITFIEHETDERADHLLDTVEILTASLEDLEILGEEGGDKFWSQRVQEAIAAIPFFSSLTEVERKSLIETATLHGSSAGEMIVREGDPGRSIYVVLNGRVRMCTRDHRGEELELAILGVSEFFGEASFLTGEPRSSNVAALETSALMELSYTSMRKLIQENPAVKKIILEYHQERLRNTQEKRAEHDMEERRHDPRLKEHVPVKVLTFQEIASGEEVSTSALQGLSVDISLSGIVVALSESAPDMAQSADQLRLEIELPKPWGEIRVLGSVRWVKPSETKKKVTLVGIEFEGASDTDAKKLKEFLHGESHANSNS